MASCTEIRNTLSATGASRAAPKAKEPCCAHIVDSLSALGVKTPSSWCVRRDGFAGSDHAIWKHTCVR